MCSNHWRCDSVPSVILFIHHVIRPRFNSWNKVSTWCKYIFETVLFAVTFHHKMLILLLNWINKRCQLQLFLWLEFYLQVQILQVIIQCAVYIHEVVFMQLPVPPLSFSSVFSSSVSFLAVSVSECSPGFFVWTSSSGSWSSPAQLSVWPPALDPEMAGNDFLNTRMPNSP